MTRDVIMQFMWGYQGHFRLALERLGRDCIGELSPDLHPRALLIGLRTPDSKSAHAVCIEPEDGDVTQGLFDGLEDRVCRFSRPMDPLTPGFSRPFPP
jgi:hypothetical protein